MRKQTVHVIKKKTISYSILVGLILHLITSLVDAQTHVCLVEGDWYNASNYGQDPDSDTAQKATNYKYVDDEMTKIVSVRFWTHSDVEYEPVPGFSVPAVPDQHFRGFEITFETSSGTQVETFGETSVLATNEYGGTIN